MNWRLFLILLALSWLLVGYTAWHRDRLPAIFGTGTSPVSPDELWTLNPE